MAHYIELKIFQMKEPLWESDESPVLANFEPIYDIHASKNIIAMLWNSFVEKPCLGQQLLKIPIVITDPPPNIFKIFCSIKISDDNTFELTQVITYLSKLRHYLLSHRSRFVTMIISDIYTFCNIF